MSFNNSIKIFLALAVAGVIALISASISGIMVQTDEIEDHAVYIEDSGVSVSAKPSGPDDISAMIATADIAHGKKKAKACLTCHSFNKNGKKGTGPNLWNIVGNDKASETGFSYSKSMQDFGGIWDENELNKFLYKPKSYIKGTKMTYVGIKKNKDRAAVIAYLKSLSE